LSLTNTGFLYIYVGYFGAEFDCSKIQSGRHT
jgi:hypothetical protein